MITICTVTWACQMLSLRWAQKLPMCDPYPSIPDPEENPRTPLQDTRYYGERREVEEFPKQDEDESEAWASL